jgi:ketosteroid isomerase-like protein
MAESNADKARRGYDAAVRGDLGTVSEFLDPDVKWHGGDPTAPGACRNRQEALEFMRQVRTHGRIGELVEVIEAGDQVVVIMRPVRGEGEEPTLSANVTTFRDGRAVEMVHYPSPDDALAAASVERSPR